MCTKLSILFLKSVQKAFSMCVKSICEHDEEHNLDYLLFNYDACEFADCFIMTTLKKEYIQEYVYKI